MEIDFSSKVYSKSLLKGSPLSCTSFDLREALKKLHSKRWVTKDALPSISLERLTQGGLKWTPFGSLKKG